MESTINISFRKKSILASSFFVILAGLAGIGLSSTEVMAAGKKAKSAPTVNIEPGAKAIEELDPKAFDRSENIDHPWWPLKPGMQWIFEGYSEDEGKKVPHRIVFTVTDLVKVTDDQLRAGMRLLFLEAKLAVEPAGAAALAAAIGPLKDRLKGKKVALIVCGANIDVGSYQKHLETTP